jgi:hypothetical protein
MLLKQMNDTTASEMLEECWAQFDLHSQCARPYDKIKSSMTWLVRHTLVGEKYTIPFEQRRFVLKSLVPHSTTVTTAWEGPVKIVWLA